MEMEMPSLEKFQLNIKEEAQQLILQIAAGNLEAAEDTAYFIYKRLQEINGHNT